ncbi:hypothetical protein Mapa_008682 [Marchantia paleacea]|nr:hypothetical protein Mapa_008682 [Marchantia paleacea]
MFVDNYSPRKPSLSSSPSSSYFLLNDLHVTLTQPLRRDLDPHGERETHTHTQTQSTRVPASVPPYCILYSLVNKCFGGLLLVVHECISECFRIDCRIRFPSRLGNCGCLLVRLLRVVLARKEGGREGVRAGRW